MITFRYEEGTVITRESSAGLFFYIKSGSNDLIYNCIKSPFGDRPLYPDMLLKSEYAEAEITDSDMYEAGVRAMREYDSAHVFFMSVQDEDKFFDFVKKAERVLAKTDNGEDACFDRLCSDLKLSETMKHSFRQLMAYGELSGISFREITAGYSLPVRDKKEGKKIYEDIRKRILE